MTQLYHQQLHRLNQARRTYKIRHILYRTVLGLSALCTLGISFILLESIFRFCTSIRFGFIITLLMSGFGLFLWTHFIPTLSLWNSKLPSDDTLAQKIGETFPEIRDRLIDALQVFRDHSKHLDGTSDALAESALKDIHEKSNSLDYRTAFKYPPLFSVLRNLSILILAGSVLFLFFPMSMRNAFHRLIHPLTSYEKPMPFQWIAYPGNIQLIQGDSLKITVDISGLIPEYIHLVTRESDRQPREIQLNPPFEYTINDINRSFDYHLKSGGFKSSLFHVTVFERPILRCLQVRLVPPAYTGIPSQPMESNTGDIHALKGTRAELTITSSHPLISSSLMFESRASQLMSLIPPVHAKHVLSVFRPDDYWFIITDTQGLNNVNPIHYTIRIRSDLNPVAEITSPAKNTDLDEQMRLPLSLVAEDDFGLSLARIGYWIDHGGTMQSAFPETLYSPVDFDPPNAQRLTLNHVFDLDPLGLLPLDQIGYFFEVFDNDRISGPKIGRSDTYIARFPSMLEIFEDVTRMQDDQIHSLESMAEKVEALDKKLKDISNDIKANREIPWEKRREIKETVEKQHQIEQQVDALENDIDNMLEKLQKNDLVSMETLEKYQELHNLFEEISTPELQEAMKRFQKSLEEMDQEVLRQAAENMEINQEMLLKSLERTIALLKKIHVEQKLDEMIERAETMSNHQQSVNESLKQTGAFDSLASQECEIQNEAASFEQAMQNLSETMPEIPNMPVQKMQALMDSLNRQQLSQQMSRMSDQISQRRSQSALQEGQNISQRLSNFSQGLQQMKQSMQNQQLQKTHRSLQRAAFQTLQLSQSQENLMHKMQQGGVSSSESMRRQGSIMQGIKQISDSLYQLSTQMIMMSPQIGKSIGRARAHMQQAAEAMQQSGGGVSRHQAQAMGALNETAVQIQDMLENLQSGGMGGMGMDQFIMQMGNMSLQQMALNRKLSDMMGQGELSLNQQAAMSRLAAEQRAIQRHMEKLMRKYGERSNVAGRLGDLIESMENVIQELQNNQASNKTIERQERILSRMLEAQRSIHERDISRKRQAHTGEDILRQDPGLIRFDRSKLRDQLMRDILRLNEAGYTQDYQELIRHYFESLARMIEEEP